MKALVSRLTSRSRTLRERAREELLRLNDPACIPYILPLILNPDINVLNSVVMILQRFASNESICKFLLRKLKAPGVRVRENVILALQDLPCPDAMPTLITYAEKAKEPGIRTQALGALMKLLINHPERISKLAPIFIRATKHPAAEIRSAGYNGLAATGDPSFRAIIRRAFQDPNAAIRSTLAPHLASMSLIPSRPIKPGTDS